MARVESRRVDQHTPGAARRKPPSESRFNMKSAMSSREIRTVHTNFRLDARSGEHSSFGRWSTTRMHMEPLQPPERHERSEGLRVAEGDLCPDRGEFRSDEVDSAAVGLFAVRPCRGWPLPSSDKQKGIGRPVAKSHAGQSLVWLNAHEIGTRFLTEDRRRALRRWLDSVRRRNRKA